MQSLWLPFHLSQSSANLQMRYHSILIANLVEIIIVFLNFFCRNYIKSNRDILVSTIPHKHLVKMHSSVERTVKKNSFMCHLPCLVRDILNVTGIFREI
jgi:hypothetical protein